MYTETIQTSQTAISQLPSRLQSHTFIQVRVVALEAQRVFVVHPGRIALIDVAAQAELLAWGDVVSLIHTRTCRTAHLGG